MKLLILLRWLKGRNKSPLVQIIHTLKETDTNFLLIKYLFMHYIPLFHAGYVPQCYRYACSQHRITFIFALREREITSPSSEKY
jgi:hypothetical protein